MKDTPNEFLLHEENSLYKKDLPVTGMVFLLNEGKFCYMKEIPGQKGHSTGKQVYKNVENIPLSHRKYWEVQMKITP